MTLLREISRDELEMLIEQSVERKLQERFGVSDTRPVEALLASIERNRWTPPTDSPTNLELLRQDRER
ncbi:MAG: hypothetical protein ACOYL5_09515 [Phototrophicaceae bacterium]|jgi:hypothetical protein